MLFQVEKEFARQRRKLSARVYCTVGAREVNNERDMVHDLRTFTNQIKRRSYQGLAIHLEVRAGETHNTIFPLGLTRGVLYAFRPLLS